MTTSTTTENGEVIEGAGVELVPVAPAPPSRTLFATDDPAEVIVRASAVADALKGVLQRQGLTMNIQGREHVRVEGWTTLGSMLGVVPVVTWTRPTEKGWEARVEARTMDGRVVGAAEAGCSRDERTWTSRDDYALRSMAQTRATSKALRGPLGFVVTLAGYAATPAEEMPRDELGANSAPAAPKATVEQLEAIKAAVAALQLKWRDLRTRMQALGMSRIPDNAEATLRWLTEPQAAALIADLNALADGGQA